MLAHLLKHIRPSAARLEAHRLYLEAAEAARNPWLYREAGVPDTLDGRFDALALHLFLLLRRLRAEGEDDAAGERQRLLAEVFFEDMDRSLREMGVGDMGVGRRVQAMAEAFYGRMRAYEGAFGDADALAAALRRNLYRHSAPPEGAAERVAAYMLAAGNQLDVQSLKEITFEEAMFAA